MTAQDSSPEPQSTPASFAFLQTMFSPEHVAVQSSWEELTQFLSAYAAQPQADKSQLPAISFAEYSTTLDHKMPACRQVTALALDLDGVGEGKQRRPYFPHEVESILTYFSQFEYVFYTSFSSKPEDLKMRLIVRLDGPIPAGDWKPCFRCAAAASQPH